MQDRIVFARLEDMPRRTKQEPVWKPTKEQVAAATKNRVNDVIDYGLDVLFVGINPGLYSAAVRHHFGRPGNRFWPALNMSDFVPEGEELLAFDDCRLPDFGMGITNLCPRASARADELSKEELERGACTLTRKVKKYRPRFVAFLGITSYRTAFGIKGGKVGLQEPTIGDAVVWVLPNPSGLNAHFQLPDIADLLNDLKRDVDRFKIARKT
jgi:TDG/mug DNA glycosylase family protein